MIGRPFVEGTVVAQMKIQYPVLISKMEFPSHLGEEEQKEIIFTLNNISSLDLVDKVRVEVHLAGNLTSDVKGEDQLIVFPIQNIPAKQHSVVAFNIRLAEHCKLFETYPFYVKKTNSQLSQFPIFLFSINRFT